MVYRRNKRCDHADGCSKQPHFGQPGSRATRCATHKEPGMVDLHCDHADGCGNSRQGALLRPAWWLTHSVLSPQGAGHG